MKIKNLQKIYVNDIILTPKFFVEVKIMPAALTHYLQVERVINSLKKLHPCFEYNKNAILWGSQGPDFILGSPTCQSRSTARWHT